MSWFDEQIRLRKQQDDETLGRALGSIADAIMGERLTDALGRSELAASAMEEILNAFHRKPRQKQEEIPTGSLEEQLDAVFDPLGIMRRTVRLDEKWYRHAVGPMLGTRKEDGAAVAFLPGKLFGYICVDVASGKRMRVSGKNADAFDTEAICFYEPLPLRALTVTDLLRFMMHQLSPSDVAWYVGLMALSSLLGLLSPLFTKWLFGEVLESESMQLLAAISVFIVCFSLCRVLFTAYQTLMNSRLETKQGIAVQAAVMQRILSLPTTFHRQYAPGELMQRSSYVQSLCTTMMNTIGMTGLSSVFSLIYIGQIFAFARSMVLPSLLITLATAIVSLVTARVQMRITKEQMLRSSKTSGMTYAMITGVQKIKLAGAEKRMFARWGRQYAKEAALLYNPPLFLKLSGTISTTIGLLGTAVLYYAAIKSHVSVADYYAFHAAYGMVSGAFLSLSGIATALAGIRPMLDMAKPIMEAEPEQTDSKETVGELNGRIEINHLTFRYDDAMPNVLDDLSLRVEAGEYLAIVGTTGCGKSTLLRLLLGFETPQKGGIYYDGRDLSTLDLQSLRRKIGTVMQDGKLFLGDIYSNIVITEPSLSMDAAWEAAEIASVAEDIRRMPMGMNTIIAEGQGGISGGQKQRLMIARAVAPKPRILFFDEATSALDNVTQKKVAEAIDGLHCTRVVIAHRLSTIRHCDRIVVLDRGKIAEEGTYEELLQRNGLFAALVARQRIDWKED